MRRTSGTPLNESTTMTEPSSEWSRPVDTLEIVLSIHINNSSSYRSGVLSVV